ncbi:rhodanese-like domain-containing protein [Fodinisporobacter ferrooxydans]|uniref:Rhodanese-like domain-containing protein n=1 Tax=Fodinisporobacter ferrooxydans TaxID=2901836 RepID=A0ABY4CSB6_9BACL|nr:rhodanese-like domain-containing protein [Alicyclobacillaceae bacterium MYW30-H2]
MNENGNVFFEEIDPAEVEQSIAERQTKIIDVREVDEYNSGHIPSAKLIPLSEFAERFQEIDPEDSVILVCRSGKRSAMACEFLARQGYSKIKNMVGGMLAWQGDVEK